MRTIPLLSILLLAAVVLPGAALGQKLTIEETRDCLRMEQDLVAEKAIIDAEGPQLRGRAEELDRLREQVEDLRRRVSARIDPVLAGDYERQRDRHYRIYEEYTADATRFNAQVAAYNDKLARFNTQCSASRYDGDLLEQARRELRIR